MHRHSWLSYALVLAQFVLIFAMVWYAGITGSIGSWIFVLLALLLGGWAIATMHFNVSVLPDVRAKQQLFTNGPYRWIRHPMYTSVLLLTGAGIINRTDYVSVCIWVTLLFVLMAKLRYEEGMLTRRFEGYASYMKRTKRLVPYIW